MRSMRQRLAAVTLIGGLTTLGIGLAAGPASAGVLDCSTQGYLGEAQSGSLHITGTPAAGSSVPAGSSISLNASWNAADFNETDKLFVCGSVDGVFNAAMSSENKGVNNDGTLTAATTVPADVPAGANVCVVTTLLGQLPTHDQGHTVSEKLCFTAAAAATTTTTMAPTTTTTAAPRTVEPTVDPGTSEAGTPSAPAVEPAPAVGGEVAQAPAPMPQLPRTGSGIDVLAGFGGVALAVGGLTRRLGRKRPSEG
jgi:hypothetical protein